MEERNMEAEEAEISETQGAGETVTEATPVAVSTANNK